jgi:hypothetical protein
MKSAHFSNNIIAIILLAVSVVISVANLVFIVSGGDPSLAYEEKPLYSELKNRIIELEKNQKDISSLNSITALDNKIDEIILEIEDFKSAVHLLDNQPIEPINADTANSQSTIKKAFEEEHEMLEPHHAITRLHSSLTDSVYLSQLEDIELLNLECKSRSCRVELLLPDTKNPESVSNKILEGLDQNIDYQISANNGEMSIYIKIADSDLE